MSKATRKCLGSFAHAMESNPERAFDIAICDLEDMARWLRSSTSQPTPLDNDSARKALVKRVGMLCAALSDGMKKHVSAALMHVEHEVFRRIHVCNETMYKCCSSLISLPYVHSHFHEHYYSLIQA